MGSWMVERQRRRRRNGVASGHLWPRVEPTEKVPITAFLSIFSVTLFKNYRKRTLKILRSEVFQWPPASCGAKRSNERSGTTELRLAKETSPENILKRGLLFYLTFWKCAIIEFRWGCTKSNERYTKCGGFDKLNHRNAKLLDSLNFF